MERIWNKRKLNTPLKRRVFVAMSGGVDSSVAAALLKKRGFNITGVFFKPWSPENGMAFCNWQQDRQDAMRVAAKLGIKFKTWDFSKEYGKLVAQYMINGYRAGLTPNPDVMCNKEIKFGLFLHKALSEGADFIATGHYARCVASRSAKLQITNYKLLKAEDKNKDQTYFLWTLTKDQLKHCLFPIGEYTKPAVRTIAKKFGLPTADKKDSQGACFVGQLDMKEFLINYIRPNNGEIKLIGTNITIGRHDGVYYYTIGQRHGLNIGNGRGPYYVVKKDIKKNIIYVANNETREGGQRTHTIINNINWIAQYPKTQLDCLVKIRYRNKSIPITISGFNPKTGKLSIKFKKPAEALAPGQSAVFYRGQEVLGGGIIT